MNPVRAVFVAALLSSLARGSPPGAGDDPRSAERLEMVQRQIAERDLRDEAMLRAMRTVPRHEFVPAELARHAYEDRALPIGLGQTISQPYIVAYETEVIQPRNGMKVLEVGTGSGY